MTTKPTKRNQFHRDMDSCSHQSIKVAVEGYGGVGKSTLTVMFVQNVFVNQYDPTIEDTYHKVVVVDDESTVLQIVDTAGQEEFHAIGNTYPARDSVGVMMVYSIASRTSFTELHRICQRIELMKNENAYNIPMVICANKIDLCDDGGENRVVSEEEGRAFAHQCGAVYLETSAKENINVKEAFTALVRYVRVPRRFRLHLVRSIALIVCLAQRYSPASPFARLPRDVAVIIAKFVLRSNVDVNLWRNVVEVENAKLRLQFKRDNPKPKCTML
jgi:GTPase KRas protein